MTETALAAMPARPLRAFATAGCPPLAAVPVEEWKRLVAEAIEPNAFFDPDYALPVSRFVHGAASSKALHAFDKGRLTAFLPVRTGI